MDVRLVRYPREMFEDNTHGLILTLTSTIYSYMCLMRCADFTSLDRGVHAKCFLLIKKI